jgi:hypothetical protein
MVKKLSHVPKHDIMEVYRGSKCKSHISKHGIRQVSGQIHILAALTPGKEQSKYIT